MKHRLHHLSLCLMGLAVPLTATAASSPYGWLASQPALETITLQARFAAPPGYTRDTTAKGSYAHWLRALPLRTDRTHVLAYDGAPLHRPSAAIVYIDVGSRDLQQCADAVLRLHAEFLWHRGLAKRASYHFTSGDRSSYGDWLKGERFKIRGATVTRVPGPARAHTHATYRRWLDHLFMYAGTRSLPRDTQPVGARRFIAGDMFLEPGSPGHVVVVLDVATGPGGQQAALLGQSYIPAEDVHVLRGAPSATVDEGRHWFLLPQREGEVLDSPSWRPFRWSEAIRFEAP